MFAKTLLLPFVFLFPVLLLTYDYKISSVHATEVAASDTTVVDNNPSGVQSNFSYNSDLEKQLDEQLNGGWMLEKTEPKLTEALNMSYHFMEGKLFYKSVNDHGTPWVNWELKADSTFYFYNKTLRMNHAKFIKLDGNHLELYLLQDSVKAYFIKIGH